MTMGQTNLWEGWMTIFVITISIFVILLIIYDYHQYNLSTYISLLSTLRSKDNFFILYSNPLDENDKNDENNENNDQDEKLSEKTADNIGDDILTNFYVKLCKTHSSSFLKYLKELDEANVNELDTSSSNTQNKKIFYRTLDFWLQNRQSADIDETHSTG